MKDYVLSLANVAFFLGGVLSGVIVTAIVLHEPTQVVPVGYVVKPVVRMHSIPADAKVCITHPDAEGDMYTDCVK
jgi:hypothetical protein